MDGWMNADIYIHIYIYIYIYVCICISICIYTSIYWELVGKRDEECIGAWMMHGMWIDRWIKAGGVNADFVLLVSSNRGKDTIVNYIYIYIYICI